MRVSRIAAWTHPPICASLCEGEARGLQDRDNRGEVDAKRLLYLATRVP
jgi:hypothetical protein